MLYGETVQSPLPQDIPWWSPDFAIFFGVLYIVLFVIASGVGYVTLRAIWETWFAGETAGHNQDKHAPSTVEACEQAPMVSTENV